MIKNELIDLGFIPLSKYWSLRLGFLDIINDTKLFIPLIENRQDLGDDGKRMITISKEWKTKKEHNVGEGAALFRYLQFASWKFKLEKTFIKEGTLKDRKICENPEIINWPISKLLELDNNTPQWASVSILLGNKEKIPNNYFLKLSDEAVNHYNKAKIDKRFCEIRYDEPILRQAGAFIELLDFGRTMFKAKQQDEYCFARAFNLISKEEGNKKWSELKSHESNRLEEMEIMLEKFQKGEEIDSKDHRVIQAIAMLGIIKGKATKVAYPNCVSKSWPQFWEFLEWAKDK